MSLVHEALQKAEREKHRKASAALAAPLARQQLAATPVSTTSSVTVVSPAVTAQVTQTAPTVAVAEQPRSHHALLTTLIVSVGIVALVAIVYLVGNATSTIRESQRAINTVTPTIASAPAAKNAPPTEPALAQAVPASEPAAPDARFRLTGITVDPGDSDKFLAIINGQLRSVNQYVDGATIKKIERDRVTIEVEGHEQVLRLF
jgi:type II secretory pathway component PulC